MDLIERLKHLEAAVDETGDDEIRVAAGWPEYMWEVEKALPKLLAVVKAVRDQRDALRWGLHEDVLSALLALEDHNAP